MAPRRRGRVFAKGRTRKRRQAGEMNGHEKAFAEAFIIPHERAGQIETWGFERYKLKLADNTTLTPDFDIVWAETGELAFYDVKANWAGKPHIEEDAWVKMKVAAEEFGVRLVVVYPSDKTKTRWVERVVGE